MYVLHSRFILKSVKFTLRSLVLVEIYLVSGAIGADFGAIWTPKQAKTKDLGGNFIDFKINRE